MFELYIYRSRTRHSVC